MKIKTAILLVLLLTIFCSVYAWVPLPVANDLLVRMPGTQPNQGVNLEAPGRCLNCHAGYDQSVEPGFNWKGSMMAQAARDPIFWACFTVALQDSIWALGNANAGDLCERCHFPEGWLGGRSDPPNASLMTGSDFDGLHCDFCHSMYDPFFETTYNGTREGSDWAGYWDEAGNTGPGSGTLSQTEAAKTYLKDRDLAALIKLFSGGNFYSKFNVPMYPAYTENAGGQFFVSGGGERRASFADAEAKHKQLYSRYHKSKYFCATCHDVSNPALANLGLSGLSDQSGGADLITEQYSAHHYFHVERTFSEFILSDYAQQGGAATNPEFEQISGGIGWVAKCQDCHMRDLTGYGCNKQGIPLRPDESTEHPNSGLPAHDMTGGNAWISYILGTLDSTHPAYDPYNVQILEKGPAALTLDLNTGETPKANGQALMAGAERAKDQLRAAATIKNFSYEPATGQLSFRIQNNTVHKLISGFPEGRRMFVNIKAFVNGCLSYEANPYDFTAGTLRGLPNSTNSPDLAPTEVYLDELVYEVHPKSDLTGEDETFHFVLATDRYKDNRIPPKGFDISNASERLCEPVWHGQKDPNYFTPEEYAGGYDDVNLIIAKDAEFVEISLY
jgi:cytochrome c553